VNNFAAKIVSQERLDCLFLLTVADIKGTNPKLWNSWRAALLHQLYDATSKALAVPLTRDNELSAVKAEARQLLAPTTFSQQAIESLWRSLNQHYFLYQTAEAVAAHTEAVLQHKINKANSNEPVVLVRSAKAAERYSSTEVFIYCIDQPNLFVRIVKALEKLDMTIHDAQITVGSDGYSANSFVVLQTDGKAIATEPSYLQVVQQRLQEALIEIVISKAPEQKYTPKRLRQFNHLIHPELASDLVNQSTLLKLTAPDRPGLLVIMAEIFVEFKLNLLGAKIVTLGDQVKDIFWLVDKNKRPLKNKKTCQKLVKTIYRRLEDTSK
jgi:[protein-PII] uridylyltransferase